MAIAMVMAVVLVTEARVRPDGVLPVRSVVCRCVRRRAHEAQQHGKEEQAVEESKDHHAEEDL